MTNLNSIKKQRHLFTDKVLYSQSYVFSSSHVQMWESDHKEGWVLKNWCFRIVVLEKTLESSLDNKEIKPVNPKGNQYWIHWKDWCWSSNTWPPDVKSLLTGKDPDAGKDWRQEEKGTTENKMLREMKDREAWSPAVQHHQTPNNTSLYSSYQSIHCDFE